MAIERSFTTGTRVGTRPEVTGDST
jgi:hypothetical protein